MPAGERMRKIREISRMSQQAVSEKMKISISTYSFLEEGINPKYSYLEKFCKAVNVDMPVLLSEDLLITEENLLFFDKLKQKSFLLSYEQLHQKVEVYAEILKLDDTNSNNKIPNA